MFDFTDFARKEETLSRTKAFNLRQSAALSADAISFISVLLMGLIAAPRGLHLLSDKQANNRGLESLQRLNLWFRVQSDIRAKSRPLGLKNDGTRPMLRRQQGVGPAR